MSDTLFVYSIIPHCIVQIDHHHQKHSTSANNHSTSDELAVVKVVYNTVIKSSLPVWIYGTPRGGTPSQLVDTIYGMKYLSFFHSHSKYNHPVITTWYIGAYLFGNI